MTVAASDHLYGAMFLIPPRLGHIHTPAGGHRDFPHSTDHFVQNIGLIHDFPAWKNKLYYGDNLDVLRRHVDDESVDLIYLDPPFKSNADYNILFKEKDGSK